MKEITIQAITEKGEKALRTHWQESKKMKIRDRLIFKTAGYQQELIMEKPYTLKLLVNNRHSANPVFMDLLKSEIEKGLLWNGATINMDYDITIHN